MSMIDTLRLFGADTKRVCCAAAHPAEHALTTKSFDCNHDDFYVFDGQLYVSRRDEHGDDLGPSIEGEKLVLSRREFAAKLDFTGQVRVYTHCEECDPIIFEREYIDRTDHRHVWCEWQLIFDHGKFLRVDPVRLETPEHLREQMLRDGAGVLPDDDRIAKKHMKQLREGRRNLW